MIKIKVIRENEKGSVIIFSAMIIMIMLMIAFLNMVLSFIFMDQVIVLDALDSAVTSALSQAEEVFRNTYYYEKLVITDYEVIDGMQFPTEYTWVKDSGTEGYPANYIRLNYNDAYSKAVEYFNKYLELNDVKNYEILNFDLIIDYDNERYLPVVNTRYFTFKAGEPSAWWKKEFGDSGSFQFPNQLIYVRFPRWVKVQINTSIRLPIPFGIGLSNVLEDNNKSKYLTIKRSYSSAGVKELKVVNPPPIFAWE